MFEAQAKQLDLLKAIILFVFECQYAVIFSSFVYILRLSTENPTFSLPHDPRIPVQGRTAEWYLSPVCLALKS